MPFLIAFLPSLLYGSQQMLMGAFPASVRRQNTAVVLGAGLASLLAVPVVGGGWSARALLFGVLAGLLWTSGQVVILHAMQTWGVSRTIPLSASGQITINAVVGVTLLGEWRAPGALPLGVAGVVAIMVGAAGCSWQEGSSGGLGRPTPAQRREGLAYTLASAVLFGAYPCMLRLAGVGAQDAVGPMGVGLLLGALVLALVLPRTDALVGAGSLPSAVSGMVWAAGNAILLLSTAVVGVATALALSQLSFLVSTPGGILLLGERKTRREAVVTAAGVLVAVLGVALLGLASTR